MAQEVTLPALGESVTEGTVTRWLKKVGDTVAVDEPLVEISTDKVDTEIPSPVAGVVEAILVAEDETVEVGAVLARIGDGSGVGAAPAAPAAGSRAPPQAANGRTSTRYRPGRNRRSRIHPHPSAARPAPWSRPEERARASPSSSASARRPARLPRPPPARPSTGVAPDRTAPIRARKTGPRPRRTGRQSDRWTWDSLRSLEI
jgi:2-oxoglutarate dehydrogenase E2 component (dihydrolipoamide succinyltransferase)